MKKNNENLKILLTTNTLGKWGEINGVADCYNYLIPEFKNQDITLDIITFGPQDKIEKIDNITIITYRPKFPEFFLDKIEPVLRIGPGVRFSRTINDCLSENKYDVVHIASPCPLGHLALSIAERDNSAKIGVYHTLIAQYVSERIAKAINVEKNHPIPTSAESITNEIISNFYNNMDLILVPSKYVIELINKSISPPLKLWTRGVDLEKFNKKYRTTETNERAKAIYVGRIEPEKNLELLINVFSDRDNCDLVIVGEGSYLNELKQRLPNAKYTGKLRDKLLAEEYANADFFVFPSETDTYGQVVIQAHSSGLPVIVTDKGGPKEQIIHGENGFIATNIHSFRYYIDTLINNEELRKKMSDNAYYNAINNPWHERCKELIDHYYLALNSRTFKTEIPPTFIPQLSLS
ncbi:MAG: glycosyltransferase [Candidatus Woesearchaeota archaeon]